jgi:hypothetical protein
MEHNEKEREREKREKEREGEERALSFPLLSLFAVSLSFLCTKAMV